MTGQPDQINDESASLLIKIGGMQCSFCVESLRKSFSKMSGIVDTAVNLAHEEALIEYQTEEITESEIHEVIRDMGFKIRDPDKIKAFEMQKRDLQLYKKQLIIASLVTLLALILMILVWSGYTSRSTKWIMLSLTLIMIFGIGNSILRMSISSLRRRILNQHVLMEFGAIGGLIGGLIGFFYQPWPMSDFLGAAISITAYHILSGYVSSVVRINSSNAIMKLLELQPPSARVITKGSEKEVPIEEIKVGDHVKVRPGESIPVDGVIIEGVSSVDQSLVTGESITIPKLKGDFVIGGSINQFGYLIIEVMKIGEDTFLFQVSKAIEEARAMKPGIVLLVERFLKYFVPGVLIAATLSFVFWILGPWIISDPPDVQRAIFAALAVLVMGYPCALGMATPLAMIKGSGIAAHNGIIFRSGATFQTFGNVDVMAFDKTGTLTKGKPQVLEIHPSKSYSDADVVSTACLLEYHSEHPLGRSIRDYAEEHSIPLNLDPQQVIDFQSMPGKGIKGKIEGDEIWVGNQRMLEEVGIDIVDAGKRIESLKNKGFTVICVAKNTSLIGIIGSADEVKNDAKTTITELIAMGVTPILLTGDNKRVAMSIALQVGIETVFSDLLPKDKVDHITKLQREGKRVVMVGDGINDAPALMQADIGIAYNSGTDVAIESADIILTNNSVNGILMARHIAISSHRKTVQNVTLAFLFNGIGVPLAMTGLVAPIYAMIAMVASVSVVLVNSFVANKPTFSTFNQNYESKMEQEPKHRHLDVNVHAEDLSEVNFTIPSLHCEGCISNLQNQFDQEKGIISTSGNFETKSLSIVYNRSVIDEGQLEDVIRANGHKLIIKKLDLL